MIDFFYILIPAVSGLLGTIIGGWITSRAAIKRIDFDAKQLRYQSKMNAYSAFISGYQQFILTVKKARTKNADFLSDDETDGGCTRCCGNGRQQSNSTWLVWSSR